MNTSVSRTVCCYQSKSSPSSTTSRWSACQTSLSSTNGPHPLRDLTPEERERHAEAGYVKFEPYPETESSLTGRYWTQKQLDAVDSGCGVETRMGLAIAETYARNPSFYGSTYCIGCSMHLPVSEFRWEDGSQVGS